MIINIVCGKEVDINSYTVRKDQAEAAYKILRRVINGTVGICGN